MKTMQLIIAGLLISLVACKATREGIKQDYKETKDDVADALTKTHEEIQSEKVDLSSAIAAQRTRVEQNLEDIKERDFDEKFKKDVEYTSGKLEEQLEQLDDFTENVSDVNDEEWGDLKNGIEDSLEEMEDQREELTQRLYADLD
jgi:hypothetical protein